MDYNLKNLPPRRQFTFKEWIAVSNVFIHYFKKNKDWGYQDYFENKFCQEFAYYHGGGYCDAVNSGSSAILLALKAIKIKNGDQILISPVTNPGSVMPAYLLGAKIKVIDSEKNSFNISHESLKKAINKDIKALIITHTAGIPVDIDPIVSICKAHEIKIIEDCSQSHGSRINGKLCGTFGDISIWSTMFSKTVSTGGCGGVYFTRDYKLYRKMRLYSDRGKPFDKKNFVPRYFDQYALAGFNFNQDELSCAIGSSTLKRLDKIIYLRDIFACYLSKQLVKLGSKCKVCFLKNKNFEPSYFYLIIKMDSPKLIKNKKKFVEYLELNNVPINGSCREVVTEWKWLKRELENSNTPNAINFRDSTFNLLFHEKYRKFHAIKIANMIYKSELKLLENNS